jgi:hypothetical protein
MVRAKLHVTNIEAGEEGAATIYMSPVYSGSPENEQFYKYTPSGQIILSTVNPEAAAQFVVGEEYYADFTHADA